MPEDTTAPGEGFEIESLNAEDDAVNSREGLVIGNYVVLQEIGRGGMGTVYLARHQSLDRLVAVKFLGRQLVHDPLYIEVFLREAKAASRLNHPGIVTLHDAGCLDDQTYYLIMERVEGTDLQTLLRERGLVPVEDAINYVSQAAAALGYAHSNQFIHRDVKPENLILTNDGIIKICDLGLAKKVGEDSALTQRGMVMGSPNYMAPERLSGAENIDARVDIYSLGAAFFHLLTGRIPYEGTPPVIMAMHLTAPLPDPREVNPSLPQNVCDVIRKMMAKNPDQRFRSMAEVAEALAVCRS